MSSVLNRNNLSPLNKVEQKVLSSLATRHEKEGLLTCPTGGQSRHYVHVSKPRKNTGSATKRVVQQRALNISKVRNAVAGKYIKSVRNNKDMN